MTSIINNFFPGIPLFFQVLFSFTVLVILFVLFWTILLFIKSRQQIKTQPEPGGDEEINWIFFVPALNEEITIADSIDRLKNLETSAEKKIIVINDGSDDKTSAVVEDLKKSTPELILLNRSLPEARLGKSAALNHAFSYLKNETDLINKDKKNVVCVIDADGRLSKDSLKFIAPYFLKENSGGVQCLVRIYNRYGLLTKAQNIEFSVYGNLFQAGRSNWGSAGMGGNGQFNSWEALDCLAQTNKEGPWRDKLTEDQDLGLRLILAGFNLHHDNRATVDQQGLNSFRLLLKQRTRWSQGNIQAISLLPKFLKSKLNISPVARIELIVSLLMPIYQALIGVSLISALCLAIFGGVSFWENNGILWLVIIYLLGFSGVMIGCIAARLKIGHAWTGVIQGALIGQVYAFYTWILWPVLVRSGIRQLLKRRSWAKTRREKIK